jgi:hypothetical protein
VVPFDFKQLLVEKPDPQLMEEHNEATWAYIGQRLYNNVMDEKFVMAVVTSFLASANPPPGMQPNQFAARKLRTFIFSGTITR